MVCRLRSNDSVKMSRANVAGTVSVDDLIALVVAVVVAVVDAVVVGVIDAVAFIVVIGALDALRLTILAQDIVSSMFRCADDCLHCI
jgi:hypothetical protein